jgi:hypothetical protein
MSSAKTKKPSSWLLGCLIVLLSYSVDVVTPSKMGHVEPLSLKESVIRNQNGVMVMTLSPRRTVLSLSKNGKKDLNGQKVRGGSYKRQRASVMYANIGNPKAFPSPFDNNANVVQEAVVDNETEGNLIENQTESVPNSNSHPSSTSFEPEDEFFIIAENQEHQHDDDETQSAEQTQTHHGDEDDDNSDDDNELRSYLPHDSVASSSNENENTSQLPRSALHNDSSPTTNKKKKGSSSGSLKDEEEAPDATPGHSSKEDLVVDFPFSDEDESLIVGFLQREIWTIPLFVFASLNIFLITFFEIYVLCRTKGQSRQHLFLGQMLLFGLFLSSSLALLFAVYPSVVGCFIGRLGVGIAYSMIFAVLMVKCLFLLSLDVGVYLPTSYQGCLLFFTVLVQIGLDTQRAIFFPPKILVKILIISSLNMYNFCS